MSVRMDRQRGTWLFIVDTEPGLDGKRRQVRRRGFLTKREAQAAEREFLAGAGGVAAAPQRLTFATFLVERWLPALDADERLKPKTKASYRLGVKHLVAHAGHVPLVELTGEHLDYVQRQLADRSASLRHQVHVTASKSLRQALRWRLLARSPVDDATPPPQPTTTPTSWSPAQVAVFLQHAERDRWWPLWLLAAVSAMRRGELVALTWPQIDLARGEVFVDRATVVDGAVLHQSTTKSGRSRTIALDDATVAVLRTWRARQAAELLALGQYRPDHDGVFTWPDGAVVHPNVITRTFNRLAARAALPPLHLHSLRHAWANAALDADVELVDVSKRLGHSSIRVTADVYTPSSTRRDRAAVEAVAALYRSTAST